MNSSIILKARRTPRSSFMCTRSFYERQPRRRKGGKLATYLDGEAFEYYLHNSTKNDAPDEESRSFRKAKAEFLEKFSNKKTEAEVTDTQ